MTDHIPISSEDLESPSSVDMSQIRKLRGVIDYLHGDMERTKTALARELHDQLSGSLIAAMMDITWVERQEAGLKPDTHTRLTRIKDSLRAAIDLSRKLVEDLRPTLLDAMGLFAALSWQFKRGSELAGISYHEHYPTATVQMENDTLITLFRIVQELFNFLIDEDVPARVDLDVITGDHSLQLSLSGNGGSMSASPDASSPAISSILHRVAQIGGELHILKQTACLNFTLEVPLPA